MDQIGGVRIREGVGEERTSDEEERKKTQMQQSGSVTYIYISEYVYSV